MKANNDKQKINQGAVARLYRRTLAMLGIAGGIILILRILLRGKVANYLVTFFSRLLGIDWETGKHIYWESIGSHISVIIIAAFVIVFLILFRLSLNIFNKYFKELQRGIGLLAKESKEEIKLKPGLEDMEDTLNDVRIKLIGSQERLKEEEQRRNDLVLYLAHDIKTPLTSVVGYLNLLDKSKDMPLEQKDKYITVAREKAERLTELINEFFDITRYTYQAEQLYLQRVSLEFMLLQIEDEMYPQLKAKGKSLLIDMKEDIYLNLDPAKMARVFQNIIKNAIAYGQEGCQIKVSAYKQQEHAYIFLENAADIPPEKAQRLFEKFYRLDAARSTETGGAGLGLAIARDIVTLHKGQIKAESDGETIQFKIRLPLNLEIEKEEDRGN